MRAYHVEVFFVIDDNDNYGIVIFFGDHLCPSDCLRDRIVGHMRREE